jgi:hypothetical protein
MKKIITLFTFLLAASFGVYAQTNNLNEYNLKVYFNLGEGVVDNDGNDDKGESRYHIRAGNYENSSSPTHLLNTNVGADNGVRNYGSTGPATYYGYDNNPNVGGSWTGPQVYYPILPNGSNSLTTTQSNTTGKFNVSVMSYAWDSGLSYIYQGEPNGNMGFLDQTVSFALNKFPNNESTDSGEIDNAADGIYRYGYYEGYGTDSYYRIKSCFRPKHGKKNDPLDFGTLVSGAAAISQNNSNRSSPNSTYYNSTDFGYSNDWDGVVNGSTFYPGNDITYKFTITKQQTVKWTIYKTTSDSQKFLVSRLMDANNVAIYGSFQSSFGQDHSIVLCAGTYTLVLDGYGNSNTSASSFHDFNISITATDYSPNPGSIANSTNDFLLCPNEAIPAINNASSASGTVGTPTYQWWKQLRVNGVAQGWVQYTAAGTGASATNLGTMENADFCWIMRFATDCGGGVWSNQMGFTRHNVTLNAGTITGSAIIPFPQEQDGSLTSDISASAGPSQTILWQKSTNNGATWLTADGYNIGQSYTLPSSINQKTVFRRKVSNACDGIASYDGVRYSNEEIIKIVLPNGKISGKVTDRNGLNGINGITVTARRTSPVAGGLTNKEYTIVTANGGLFSLSGIYYGDTDPLLNESADFVVTPSKPGHGFDPDEATPTLLRADPEFGGLVFKDTTGFTITGFVTQECTDCDGASLTAPKVFNLEGVTILENNQNLGHDTDENGQYATIKEFEGTYIIKPVYETHQFAPETKSIIVGANVVEAGKNFKDTTTHVITGNVIKNCTDPYIGKATLTFSQVLPDKNGNPVSAVFTKTIQTNAGSGAYSVRLPAAKYKVIVNSFSNVPSGKDLNASEMVNFLNAYPDSILVRDITNTDTTMNLIYHEAPQIVAYGLEGPCSTGTVPNPGDLSLNPIFIQNVPKSFLVRVYEGRESKQCPVVDSVLIVNTNIEGDDQNEETQIMTVNGEKEITLIADLPNIVAPYHKTLSLVFTDIWMRTAPNLVATPVVTGLKSNVGSFATVSPSIPFLILRDPPGDESFSFWEENKVVETANRFYSTDAKSVEAWANVRVGVELETGLGVSTTTKVWGDLGGSLEMVGSSSDATEMILTTENSQYYSTSDQSNVTGTDGDVYIGGAMNLLYSVTNEIIYSEDSCKFYGKKKLMIAQDGFATTYTYSESHIVNTLIPLLRTFRDNPSNTQAETDNYENQVSVWEQIIENNRVLKRNAVFSENISFDGGTGPQTSSTTTTSTGVSTIEFSMEINAGVAAELGLEVAGSGLSGGVNTMFKMETGGATSVTNTQSTTTGFTINDNDLGDFFTVDIKKDPVYNTPVFELVAGTSSCPHEEGTQPRDDIYLTVANPVHAGLTAGSTEIFNLDLSNTSQSEETRTYFFRYLTSSSTGVTVNVEGNGVGPFDYPLNYLENKEITVSVKQFDPNIYSFEGMRFQAYDACENGSVVDIDISKEAQISAFYNNACSPVTLALPEEGYIVNSNSNLLPIKILDYLYNNLDNISLEYSKVGTSNWTNAFTLQKNQIDNNPYGTIVNFDVTNLDDGSYNLRLKLKCGLQTVYSKRVTGIIDRKAPKQFGIPEPADDVYALGDEISIDFDENLGCDSFNSSNFTMTRLSTGTPIPAILGCFQNKIILTPTTDILPWIGDSVRVSLVNISDDHGNVSPKTFSWKFNIGTAVPNASSFLANLVPQGGGVSNFSDEKGNSDPKLIAVSSLSEDDLGTMKVDFSFNSPATDSLVVYFIVAGTATYGVDYTVSGHKTFNGNEGSITIKKGTTKRTLKIDPIADTNFELDESIILGLLTGGDYNIGGSNKVTLTILNDDQDDCDNGGLLFTQNNNASSNTTLAAGTYHKALLASDAFVQSPTTVIFKGEKSITLTPGFETQSGSVFIAIQEDCPNLALSLANAAIALEEAEKANQALSTYASPSMNAFQTQSLDANGVVSFAFENEDTQRYNVFLYDFSGSLIADLTDETIYTPGSNAINFDTDDIPNGEYYLIIQPRRVGETKYHKLAITDSKNSNKSK